MSSYEIKTLPDVKETQKLLLLIFDGYKHLLSLTVDSEASSLLVQWDWVAKNLGKLVNTKVLLKPSKIHEARQLVERFLLSCQRGDGRDPENFFAEASQLFACLPPSK